MNFTNWAIKLGAIFYVLWGLLHLYAAWLGFELAGSEEFGVIQSKLYQNAWNLGLIALFAIVIGAWLNWKNSLTGYLLNAIVISVTDIGFVIFILLPGISNDWIGPILWLLGLLFSTIGIMRAPRTT